MDNTPVISLSSKALANILELIKMMTGLKNFNEVYLKYAQIINNLHDEYYEHPKQSDVEHYVNGLIEKYHVHGFPLEAKEFEMRIHRFINYSNINNRSKLSSNVVKWAIIGMIINMANNPCGSRNAFRKTNLDTVRIELEGETAVLGDSWKTDLIQELLSIGRTSYYIKSDSETDSEDEADFRSLNVVSPQKIIVNGIKDRNNSLSSREYLKLVFSHENIARNLLIKRASQLWWLNKSETIAKDGQYSFYFNLKKYTNNKIFKIIDDNFIILECLKNNLTSSYILQYSLEEQRKLFGCMTISSSISPEVFNRWILTISPYIKQFSHLIQFTCYLKGLKKVSYTLRAYAKGLECILEPIINKMGLIENRIKNCVGHDTLLSFEEEMYMHFQIISYVYSVHSKAVDSNWESIDNWKTSIKLISVLFWSIQTAIIDYQKLIVVTLFLYAFEPYVHMTELWIHAGQLVDENNEFIIHNYEGDSSIAFNIFFKDIHKYLKDCNLCVPQILEYLIHFLNNCDWKVFVASEMSNDAIALCEVPRGELYNSFLVEIKNSNTFWKNYINPLNEYNPSNWNKLPLLASACIHYKFTTDQSTFDLTIPSSYEMVDMFLLIIQKAINNIGLVVGDIVLKKNKFVYHLKNLYNIIFMEDVNKSVQIDRAMEYKIERNSFLNNCFYSLLSDDHSSILSSNHSCNLSLNYKTEKYNFFGENDVFNDNFADELERITITYDVKFPLSLILTNEVIFYYNKIFRLLITAKQAVAMISQLQTKDLNKYDNSLDVKRMYFIRLWIMSTTYKLQTYFFSVASRYLGSKLFDSIKNVKNGLDAFEKVLEDHVSQAIRLCMLSGSMEKFSYESLALLWNACEQFTKLWMKSVTEDSIDVELMEKIEQEYVDSCWKLASSLDTYLLSEDDTSSILFEFCRDFMSSMPTKESADLDGSLIYKLSDSQNRYSFTYI
ncbi:uncharacterized protein LOC114130709 [Aphis gossypii]|uniref:Gamma-tubulin complex component n=2 Tax=Aphis gossypii TaxID=80765 RepID=A0A9P0IZY6_APHGO|nr:uncharacterized protein LOC114130709 [Aphis gossypii]CAH1722627.1 unnamed protein product [Aphis gossypii]